MEIIFRHPKLNFDAGKVLSQKFLMDMRNPPYKKRKYFQKLNFRNLCVPRQGRSLFSFDLSTAMLYFLGYELFNRNAFVMNSKRKLLFFMQH